MLNEVVKKYQQHFFHEVIWIFLRAYWLNFFHEGVIGEVFTCEQFFTHQIMPSFRRTEKLMGRNFEKFYIRMIRLDFQTRFKEHVLFKEYWLNFFHGSLVRQFSTCRGTFKNVVLRLTPCIGKPMNLNCEKAQIFLSFLKCELTFLRNYRIYFFHQGVNRKFFKIFKVSRWALGKRALEASDGTSGKCHLYWFFSKFKLNILPTTC